MEEGFRKALAAGYEKMVAWADILDRINVYPVPDGDTGRNLVMTLSVFRNAPGDGESLIREILFAARGNSGNIAARFLAGFLKGGNRESLPACARIGREFAYQAVSRPQPGTMLSLFDTLAASLEKTPPEENGNWAAATVQDLEGAVKKTTEQLSELKKAGVVDAGALGMFVFLSPFLLTLAGNDGRQFLFTDGLKEALSFSSPLQEREYKGYCLDVTLQVDREEKDVKKQLQEMGESIIAMPGEGCLKLHLHAVDREKARRELAAIGAILSWAEDDLGEQTLRFLRPPRSQAIHIMTDAAGSISRDLARTLGITLLNSYITIGTRSFPETYVDPARLFAAMQEGIKVATSQASEAERYESYQNVLKGSDRVLYLCVGSFYTGNYETAMKWKARNDPGDRMTIIDTGVASGKLGLVGRMAAEFALSARDPGEVIAYCREALGKVQEYIFLDRLQFLAAGGRMSKTGAFFGDFLNIKPIVSPYPDGARRLGVVRNPQDQLKFACERLEEGLPKDRAAALLLEYSDNRERLEKEIKPEIERRFPRAKVSLQLLSLTSAAHMGPGSWGIAFFPEEPWGRGAG